jgi:predicted DNA-binding antitoxin AbrB/MazE fold protein
MARTIEAVYENGVFRPLQPVDLEDGQRVQVYLPFEGSKLTAEEALEMMRKTHKIFGEVSDEEWEKIAEGWKRG